MKVGNNQKSCSKVLGAMCAPNHLGLNSYLRFVLPSPIKQGPISKTCPFSIAKPHKMLGASIIKLLLINSDKTSYFHFHYNVSTWRKGMHLYLPAYQILT